jgi:hypothetical protein
VFVRIKRSAQSSGTYEYLQIVESYREGTKVRQRVLASLGRRADLVGSAKLDGLLQSLAQYSERLAVVQRVRLAGLAAPTTRAWGAALVFRRLWEEQGIDGIVRELAADRRFEFDLPNVVFALALQRLCAPGSDRQGARWVKTVEADGFDAIELQHLYRAFAFLGEVRDELEAKLFAADHPSGEVDLLFIDTTSTYVYSDEPTVLRRRGYSRDRRPDLRQVVLCVAVDTTGRPVAWDIHPGNTADSTAFVATIARLRERFNVRRCVVVGDRGMISAQSVSILEEHDESPFEYILGTKMRSQKEVSEEVLSRAGRYRKVADNLEVKEVTIQGRRYIVCRNPEEARRDALSRQAIVERLQDELRSGPKSLIGNKAYRRFLRATRGALTIDEAAIERDARLDGKFVLRTNTKLPSDAVARAYKGLWRVERAFREQKSTLDVRPIYHRRDDMTVGHIVACFLALRLEVDLRARLAAECEPPEAEPVRWPDLMRDLAEVRAVEVEMDGQHYRLRTDLCGQSGLAFKAVRLAPPPSLVHIGPAVDGTGGRAT